VDEPGAGEGPGKANSPIAAPLIKPGDLVVAQSLLSQPIHHIFGMLVAQFAGLAPISSLDIL